MARYDSPIGSGYVDRLPGVGEFDSRSMTAPGTDGLSASDTFGPVVGDPVVSVPFASSQPAEGRPRLEVTSGDTSGMSNDDAVPEPSLFLPVTGAGETGAGRGAARQGDAASHPNSLGRGPA